MVDSLLGIRKMDKIILRVSPIVKYPKCIIESGKQNDCHTCKDKNECMKEEPRSMCIRPYKNHKYGCPNFGKLPTCPPNIPCMYDQIFDINEVYAIITKFNLEEYFNKRRMNNPLLAEGQIKNLRNYQPITIKENDYAISEFYQENPNKSDFVATRLLECMGVDVVGTLKNVDFNLVFPPKEFVYRVSFLARILDDVLEEYGFQIYEETNKHKKGIKTLIKRQ